MNYKNIIYLLIILTILISFNNAFSASYTECIRCDATGTNTFALLGTTTVNYGNGQEFNLSQTMILYYYKYHVYSKTGTFNHKAYIGIFNNSWNGTMLGNITVWMNSSNIVGWQIANFSGKNIKLYKNQQYFAKFVKYDTWSSNEYIQFYNIGGTDYKGSGSAAMMTEWRLEINTWSGTTGNYDLSMNVTGYDPIVVPALNFSNYNMTSDGGCVNWRTNKLNACNTTDRTPTITLTTNTAANLSITSFNSTNFNASRICSSTGGTSHICTLYSQNQLNPGISYIYINGVNLGNASNTYSSTGLKINYVTHITYTVNKPLNNSLVNGTNTILNITYKHSTPLNATWIKFYKYNGSNILLGQVNGTNNNKTAIYNWTGLNYNTSYYWFAMIYDGYNIKNTTRYKFNTVNKFNQQYCKNISSVKFKVNMSSAVIKNIKNGTKFVTKITSYNNPVINQTTCLYNISTTTNSLLYMKTNTQYNTFKIKCSNSTVINARYLNSTNRNIVNITTGTKQYIKCWADFINETQSRNLTITVS